MDRASEGDAEDLIELLRAQGEIEWCGFSEQPPHRIIWRWREPNPESGRKVQDAVEAFAGRVDWSVFAHDREHSLGGTNWCLIPTEVVLTQEREGLRTDAEACAWLAVNRPNWVRGADADLPEVVAAIRAAFAGERRS